MTATNSVADNPYSALGLGQQSRGQSGSNALGQDAFLKPLTTQLQNQNPPAGRHRPRPAWQISTVSGVEKLNDSFVELSSSLSSARRCRPQLVGHEVLVPRVPAICRPAAR